MIKHIVLFKLKDFDTKDAKNSKLQEIKSALEALPPIITQIKSMTVGLDCNNETHDIVLDTCFESLTDIDTYSNHPDHLAIGKILKPFLENRACVDYEI